MTSMDAKYKKARKFAALFVVSIFLLVGSLIASPVTQATDLEAMQVSSIIIGEINDTPDPGIYMDCENPSLSVSLFLDRSGSVADESLRVHGHSQTLPDTYKETVNNFLDQLHGEFAPRGVKLDVFIYAFATTAVMQNPGISGNENIEDDRRLTDISTPDNLEKMKKAVERIYFNHQLVGDPAYPGHKSGTGTQYDKERGYQAAGPYEGKFHDIYQTNWDGALLEATNLASSPIYREGNRGEHFDMTVMITDGEPNLFNGHANYPRHVFNVNTPHIESRSIERPREVVTALRTGSQIAIYEPRSPMSVRGILITKEQNRSEKMAAVFGENYYSIASNFHSSLRAQLDQILQQLRDNINCETDTQYVVPRLSVSASSHDVSVRELDEQGATITISVSNTTPSSYGIIKDVVLTVRSGSTDGPILRTYNLGTMSPGQTLDRLYTITVGLGGSAEDMLFFVAEGVFEETPTVKLDRNNPSATETPQAIDITRVVTERVALPS